MHRRPQLARSGRTDKRRLQLVRRCGHAPHLAEAIADGAQLEIVKLGEAQGNRRRLRGFAGGRRGADPLQAVEHRRDHRGVVADLAVDRSRHGQLELLRLDDGGRFGMRQRPTEDLGEMVVILDPVCPQLVSRRLVAGRGHVKRVLGTREPHVDDAPALAYRQRDRGRARRSIDVTRMLLATPVFHHESEAVGVEEQPLGVARAWRPQVDQEDNRELKSFRGVNRQERHRFSARGLFRRLSDGKLGIDDLVEVAHEVADPGQGQVALKASGQLKDLAQVEQRARAAVSLGAQLGPAQVATLLEQPIEDVGDRKRVAKSSDAVRKLDQRDRL